MGGFAHGLMGLGSDCLNKGKVPVGMFFYLIIRVLKGIQRAYKLPNTPVLKASGLVKFQSLFLRTKHLKTSVKGELLAFVLRIIVRTCLPVALLLSNFNWMVPVLPGSTESGSITSVQ